jgi:hypothetical protein
MAHQSPPLPLPPTLPLLHSGERLVVVGASQEHGPEEPCWQPTTSCPEFLGTLPVVVLGGNHQARDKGKAVGLRGN